jgi:uncharacterized protein (DUF3820 family)
MAESMGKMPFGKYANIDMEDVPDKYLKWFIGERDIFERNKELCLNIKKELKYRDDFNLHVKE